VHVAAIRGDTMVLGRGAEATRIAGAAVTADYFAALGASTAIGRTLRAGDDDAPGGSPVAVLSDAFWRRHFNGDPGVIGARIVLDDAPVTVVGIARPNFHGDGASNVDVFVPLSFAMRTMGSAWRSTVGMNVVSIVAHLRRDIASGTAEAMANASLVALAMDERGHPPRVQLESLVPGRAARQSTQARIALWLGGVSVIVLLIGFANVATLLLLRAARRRREVAVRLALGASRGRLARQLLTESVLLTSLGAAAGLLVARWLADLVRATLLPSLARSEAFIGRSVLLAAIVAALVAGIAGGLAPLLQAFRTTSASELRTNTGAGSVTGSMMQRVLVGIEVALCTVLLVGAGLFVQSLERLQAQDLGITTSHLLVVELDFHGYIDGIERDATYSEQARRLAAVPGVMGATIAEAFPFGSHHVPPISVPGRAEAPTIGGQLPFMYGATPEYLAMLGVRLRQGRLFTASDRHGSPLVVLVNETMARKLWPGERALGKCIRVGYGAGEPSPVAPPTLPCREIIGVVADSRARSLVPSGSEAELMQYYLPFGQLPPLPMPDVPEVTALLVRVSGDLDRMAGQVQRAIQASAPVYARVRPYDDLMEPQRRPWRLGATLFSTFGALALCIAAAGLFGVVAYAVAQRTREIGVRLALGGRPASVARLVIAQALRMVGLGLAIGIAVSLAIAPVARSLLFETSPWDPVAAAFSMVVLLMVGVLAATVPAWRAAHVSPSIALREE
jgi:predicted permease